MQKTQKQRYWNSRTIRQCFSLKVRFMGWIFRYSQKQMLVLNLCYRVTFFTKLLGVFILRNCTGLCITFNIGATIGKQCLSCSEQLFTNPRPIEKKCFKSTYHTHIFRHVLYLPMRELCSQCFPCNNMTSLLQCNYYADIAYIIQILAYHFLSSLASRCKMLIQRINESL